MDYLHIFSLSVVSWCHIRTHFLGLMQLMLYHCVLQDFNAWCIGKCSDPTLRLIHQGPVPYNIFLRNLRPFCRKLRNFYNLWANLRSKFGRNYKSVIYGSVKFYGIGPRTVFDMCGCSKWLRCRSSDRKFSIFGPTLLPHPHASNAACVNQPL